MDPWRTDSSQTAFAHPLFAVERRRIRRGDQEREILAIASEDWVHVIPVLPDGKILLIRQWRYATEAFQLEFPGGIADHGDARSAAEQELAEETGYRAAHWRELGTVEPNPAILDNRLTVFLATGLEPIPEGERPPADPYEEIEPVPVEAGEIPRLVVSGEIRHALVLSSYLLWTLDREGGR
ncbi:MAG: NUDIX hydrolase [Acidobacteriota bacterium]|jgi:8-oxo-dGTP pyrophosphatase MutT (NUDIX family)